MGNCVNKVKKISGKRFTLKSPKTGENKLKANLRAKDLRKNHKFVRIIESGSNRKVWRVYATGKKKTLRR